MKKVQGTSLSDKNELSRAQVDAIFDLTYQFLGLLDTDGVILRANYSSLKLAGLTEEEVIGKAFWQTHWWAHDKDEQERLKEAVKKAAKGEFVRFQTSHPDKRGELHYIDFSLKPVFDEDEKVVMLVPEGRDISDVIKAQNEYKELNEELEERVQKRTEELERQNKKLHEAQLKLVNAEKLSAMGSLVPGFAHEINTPVGIGVTGISKITELNQELEALVQKKELTQSALHRYIDDVKEISEIIHNSLNRAANMIKSIKEVSVDQAGERHRDFNLHDYIKQILLSLSNQLKNKDVEVLVDVPVELVLTSYPGAYAQILTNLIMNSLIHAYGPNEKGKIIIKAQLRDRRIELVYSDDGRGISKENLSQIFDPFFTTRANEGGSGLGLQIIHEIVSVKLRGEIVCESEEGKGTRFIIKVPCNREKP